MQVRDRHLGGRREPVVVGVLQAEEVVAELRQLARAQERVGVHDERGQHLGVAVLLDGNVQHPLNQRAVESGPHAAKHREPGPGDLGAPLEVEDPQGHAEVVVVDHVEVERARLADGLDEGVVGVVLAHRHVVREQVRQRHERIVDGGLGLLHGAFELGDLLAQLAQAHPKLLPLVPLARLEQLADLLAAGVPFGLEGLQLGADRLARGQLLQQGVEVELVVPRGEGLADEIGMFLDEFACVHGVLPGKGRDRMRGAFTRQPR